MVLDVLTHPNPILRQKAAPIVAFDSALHDFIQNMFETMHHYHGVGLAATQVGILNRVLVLEYESRKLTLINPEIILMEGASTGEEGCLSLPNYRVDVTRAERIVVKAKNKLGKAIQLKEKGMIARIIQHELDHLNGILILDHAPKG